MGGKDWQDMQLGCLWQGSDLITVNARGHIIFHSLETPQQPKKVIKVSLAGISCCPTPVFWDNQGQFGLCLVLTMQQPVIVIKVSLVYASCWPHSSLSVSSRSVHILTPWQHVAVAGVIMVGLTCIGWFDFDPIATFHFISGSVRPAPHVDPIAAFSWSLWLAPHIDTITALSWSVWLAHHIDPIAACHCIRVIKVSLTCTSHWPLCNLHQGVIKVRPETYPVPRGMLDSSNDFASFSNKNLLWLTAGYISYLCFSGPHEAHHSHGSVQR